MHTDLISRLQNARTGIHIADAIGTDEALLPAINELLDAAKEAEIALATPHPKPAGSGEAVAEVTGGRDGWRGLAWLIAPSALATGTKLYAGPAANGMAAPAYGVIDPDYARIYTIARCLAWAEGYALAMHGSFTRDLDLIAVPWADRVCDPAHLVNRIVDAAGLKPPRRDDPGVKPHGRLAWTLRLPEFGDPRWVDLSILPAGPAADAELREDAERYRWLRDKANTARKSAPMVTSHPLAYSSSERRLLCGAELDSAIDEARRLAGDGGA